jgi:hypothetical protein
MKKTRSKKSRDTVRLGKVSLQMHREKNLYAILTFSIGVLIITTINSGKKSILRTCLKKSIYVERSRNR